MKANGVSTMPFAIAFCGCSVADQIGIDKSLEVSDIPVIQPSSFVSGFACTELSHRGVIRWQVVMSNGRSRQSSRLMF